MTFSLKKNSNKDFEFVGWVIKTSWLICFRSVKFHYVKETHMMLVALVKIVVASQHKRQRNKSLSRFVENALHYTNDLSYASDLPFKYFCKLSKQAETIKTGLGYD